MAQPCRYQHLFLKDNGSFIILDPAGIHGYQKMSLLEDFPEHEDVVCWIIVFLASDDEAFLALDRIGCPRPVGMSFLVLVLTGAMAFLRQDLDDDEVTDAIYEVMSRTFGSTLLGRALGPDWDTLDVNIEVEPDTIRAFRDQPDAGRVPDMPVNVASEIYARLFRDYTGSGLDETRVYRAFKETGDLFYEGIAQAISGALQN